MSAQELRANALFEEGRYREALVAYLRISPAIGSIAKIRENLGWCHLELGDVVSAERCFREATAADPASGSSAIGLATSLEVQKRPAPALQEFERAIALAPSDRQALIGAARCHEAMGEPAAAK